MTQTLKDFEWVIIDDGSVDNTKELVGVWQKNADFPIVYQWQSNQGKHIAYNTVRKIARGELFISIDSDDELVPDALAVLAKRWSQVSQEQKEYISGMMFVSKDQNGNIVGDKFPEDGEICDLIELLFVRQVKGDKGGFMQTRVFKMYPFPESVKNVYVPEMVFIHQMSKQWKMICINDVLRIYWMDERQDHLGQKMKTKKNFAGDHLSHLATLNYSMRLFWKVPRIFIVNAAFYTRLSLHLKNSLIRQIKMVKPLSAKILWLLTLPLGVFFYLRDRLKTE